MSVVSNWFINFGGGQVSGPFTEQEIRSFLFGPQFRTECFVKQGQSDWQLASRVKTIFETFDRQGYYYKQADQTVGPFTKAKLDELYTQTKILPATPVKQGIDGQWMQYSRLSIHAGQSPPPPPATLRAQNAYVNQASSTPVKSNDLTPLNTQRPGNALAQFPNTRTKTYHRKRSKRSIAALLQAVFALATAFAVLGLAIVLMWTTNVTEDAKLVPKTAQAKRSQQASYKAFNVTADHSQITISPPSLDAFSEHIRKEVEPIPNLISFTNYGFIDRRPKIFEAYVPRGSSDFERMGYDDRGGILLLMENKEKLWLIEYSGRIDVGINSRMTVYELHINPDFGTRYIEHSFIYDVSGGLSRTGNSPYAYIRCLDGKASYEGDRVHYSIHPNHQWYGIIFESFTGLYLKLFYSTNDVQANMASQDLAKLLAFLRQTRIDHMPPSQ